MASARKAIKKCYYEVLGIEQEATDEIIRKNYKLLALKYHPDKNMDNPAEATEIFRSIQEAYEVLVNPQERAWYDKHRSAILAGMDKDKISDSCFDVYPYFTTSCYSGYGDSPKSFYSVYKGVIEEIIKEDRPYFTDDDESPPFFGDASTPYENVHRFYSYWESYSTPRTFDHLDEYDTLRAPNRRVIRLMEKENKKLRDAAKKKRNDEIRALIAFIKRRDKRVDDHKKLVEIKLEEKRKKSAEHRKKQLQDRWKEAEAYKESDLFSVADLEEELKNIEENCQENDDKKRKKNKNKSKRKDQQVGDGVRISPDNQEAANVDPGAINDSNGGEEKIDKDTNEDNSDYEDLENSDLYCMACEKLFKSVKSFANHENSKKHKMNVIHLKTLLEAEDELAREDEDDAG
ncbi:dnaJ homolog subfamily C member 21-like [Panonychus citri]|uniref:dnaJ homolog subfamily C member 21-like n=1 Tax=Panonychus citri TaxID=50023 RepID=UPI0023078011|nr:dnaJ homolog subfamily C member 21-like [Panonychus citri]